MRTNKTFGLYECVVTGDEFGDRQNLVAVSKHKENLISHSKVKYDQYPVELNSLNCPPQGTPEMYYIIQETNLDIV